MDIHLNKFIDLTCFFVYFFLYINLIRIEHWIKPNKTEIQNKSYLTFLMKIKI